MIRNLLLLVVSGFPAIGSAAMRPGASGAPTGSRLVVT
jgi:hypothetical protein